MRLWEEVLLFLSEKHRKVCGGGHSNANVNALSAVCGRKCN